MPQSCVFCAIREGKLPASKIYEDEEVLAIMDIQPINPGHVLVLPKAHYGQMKDLPASLAAKIFAVVKQVEEALWKTDAIPCAGTNILQNNGRIAFQEVHHVHVHVIPRIAGDGLKVHLPTHKTERAELDELSEIIAEYL